MKLQGCPGSKEDDIIKKIQKNENFTNFIWHLNEYL